MSVVLEEEGGDGLVYVSWFFILLLLGCLLCLELLIGFDARVLWTDDFLCYGKLSVLFGLSHDFVCGAVTRPSSVEQSSGPGASRGGWGRGTVTVGDWSLPNSKECDRYINYNARILPSHA